MPELWTPGRANDVVEVSPHERRVSPTVRKTEGGSHFDDELDLESSRHAKVQAEGARLVAHLRERPDHVVYVGSAEERDKMRSVFNVWFNAGALTHHPTIRIDYGVAEGAIRITE